MWINGVESRKNGGTEKKPRPSMSIPKCDESSKVRPQVALPEEAAYVRYWVKFENRSACARWIGKPTVQENYRCDAQRHNGEQCEPGAAP